MDEWMDGWMDRSIIVVVIVMDNHNCNRLSKTSRTLIMNRRKA